MASTHRTVRGNLYDDRGTWTVRARVYDPNTGKSPQRTKSTGFKVKANTKRKAEQAAKEIIEQWERGANSAPVIRDPLFSEYVEKWLEKKEITRKGITVLSYRQYCDLHILPVLGGCRIRAITRHTLQDYANEKLKTLSVSSVKKHFAIINGALLDAVRDDIVPANVAAYVEFPQAQKYEGKAYSPEQVADLLDAAAEEGEPIRSAIILAVCYGLRRSEVCGLRWTDIDFESGKLTVSNTKTQNGAYIFEEEQTKTAGSHRTIALIDSTVPYLRELRQKQEGSGLILDKVCRWPDGRDVLPTYITAKIRKMMKKYGFEHIRVHDLRHTAASLLATQATPKQVQEFLGHSNIGTTMNIYAHILDDTRKATSGIMDGILKNSVFCSEKCSESPDMQNNGGKEHAENVLK